MPTFRTKHKATQHPKTYDQKGGTCAGFAVLGAAHHLLGVEMPEEEVYEIYEKAGLSKEGMSLKEFCEHLQDNPLESYKKKYALKVKDMQKVFNHLMSDDLSKKKAKAALRLAARFPHIAFIFGLRFMGQKEAKPMKVDDKGFLIPAPGEGHWMLHAQYLLKNLEDRTYLWYYDLEGDYRHTTARPFLWVKNSWGDDFGGKGIFNPGEYGIWLDDFWNLCHALYQVEFANPKQFQK